MKTRQDFYSFIIDDSIDKFNQNGKENISFFKFAKIS